jgi:hypothetical protein
MINRKPAYTRRIAVTAGRIGIDRHSTNPTESRPTMINRKPAYTRCIAVTAGRIGIDRHSCRTP